MSQINPDEPAQQQHIPVKILNGLTVEINKNFINKIEKESSIDKETRRNCRAIEISSKYDSDEVLVELEKLNREDYPNLFFFIIRTEIEFVEVRKKRANKESKRIEEFKNMLIKFDEGRPLILQVTSKDENVTNLYYKEENTNTFQNINRQQTFEKFQNFSTFLCFSLNKNIKKFEFEIVEKLPEDQMCSLILRFLRILNFSDIFFHKLILKCAAYGSKNNLLAALGASFFGDGRILSIEAEEYLTSTICENQESNESEIDKNLNLQCSQIPDTTAASSSELNENSAENSEGNLSRRASSSYSDNFYTSVLYTAVQNSNREVIDYLISHCTHLIQQLPFRHQVRISTAAFESNQFDVICDLLELSDFPFPKDFNNTNSIDEKLSKIAEDRLNFEDQIQKQNLKKILLFVDNNLSLKFVYNIENETALEQAINAKKYKVYFYLKSRGFKATVFDSHEEALSGKQLKIAKEFAARYRRDNVKKALTDTNNAVMLLLTRSFIHNRKINKQQETEYRAKIKKWYEDIKKIEFGSELLDVIASCENLRIIFDFESYSVENISFQHSYVLGSCFPSTKRIFIGSKLSEKNREQEIKGVLAHELCHYAMKLVYENKEHPYYKHRTDIVAKFEAIVTAIDKWSSEESENPDDECVGIISSVFEYAKQNFHPELIVRVVNILAQFDDDEEKSTYLQDKYKELFEFFRIFVLPDMKKINLRCRENVRTVNETINLLPSISERKFKFSSTKDINTLISNKSTIAISNVPKLLFINIYNFLCEKNGNLFDTQNIFIDPEKLENRAIFKKYQELIEENLQFRVFVRNSSEKWENFNKIVLNKNWNFIVVIPIESNCEQLLISMTKSKLNPTKVEINYSINDLEVESQKLLLQTKINFQTNSNLSFFDLLKNEINLPLTDADSSRTQQVDKIKSTNQEDKIIQDFCQIVDDQLLNFLIEGIQISVNTKIENDPDEKYFNFLFQQRRFIKKILDQLNNKPVNPEEEGIVFDFQDSGFSSNIHNSKISNQNMIRFDFDHLENDMIETTIKTNANETRSSWASSKNLLHCCFPCTKTSKKNSLNVEIDGDSSETLRWDSEDESLEDEEISEENISNEEEDKNSDEESDDEEKISNDEEDKTRLKISQDELYADVKNEKYVLISDIAGTGKSWVMKKFTNTLREQNPTRWVTYVDLKQFIEEFKTCETEPEFLSFMVEKILKLKHNFETKLFTKFYENGKVFILFDGFDEIAPDCAKFVAKLAKSFEANGGNQLWIATRDYFETDLKQILNLDTVYKLDEFTLEDGINFITRSWLLRDCEKKDELKSKDDFEKYVKSSPNLEAYEKAVHRIIKKISILESRSIGLPQLFKMIAENFKIDAKKSTFDFKEFKFYEKFAEGHYERWALNKGEIRQKANIKSNKLTLTFWKFHQFSAMKSLFPEYPQLPDLENEAKEWPDEEVIACGLMTKRNGIFYFLHETFREFFVADFISKHLKHTAINDDLLSIFVKILTIKKLGVIRMFLNDAIEDSSILMKIQERMKNFIQYFYEMETFAEFFSKNLENLLDFVVTVVNNGDRERIKEILNGEVICKACETRDSKMFSKFQEFLSEFLVDDELKQILKAKEYRKRNVFHIITYASDQVQVHQNLWTLYRKTINSDKELLEALSESDDGIRNVLHIAGRRSLDDVFEFVLEELDKIPLRDEIRKLLSSLGDVQQNLLQSAAYSLKSLKTHEVMWKIYRKYFEPSEILELINYVNSHDNNLLFDIINNTNENAEFIWNQMKSFMSYDEQIECLRTKRCSGQNLLQRTSHNDNPAEIRKWVTKILQEYGIEY